jgi:hypothetical protein
MRLTAFRSGKGDCLLLEGGTSGLVLVDGGMSNAYRDHVAPAMAALRQANRVLDLVYVSHIDEDHIGGVLELLNHEMAWRVHEFQISHDNPTHPVPAVPRPPVIRKIWHNAFHEQLAADPGVIEDTLAAMASILSGANSPDLLQAAVTQADLATGVAQAIKVSRRIGAKQLDIPLNPDADGKLMMRRDNQAPFAIGSMRMTVLGPTNANLLRLRKDWKKYLDTHATTLQTIREQAADDEEDLLGNSEVSRFRARLALDAQAFGDPSRVTPPNLASLTLLVREGAQVILLTGDARGDQILDGLTAAGEMPASGRLHVDVLKVQHHGAEHNIDQAFCDAVTADHYVFCGNGESGNPDPRVVDLIAERRFADGGAAKFKFWFNCSEAVSVDPEQAAHMKTVQDTVTALQSASQGRLKSKFLKTGRSLRIV